jgi:tetrahydromethanopterin S-methyltransferase subunit G
MKKKMTIDTLARMTQDQFSRIDERFDRVDQRFNEVDQRFDKIDKTLKTVLGVVLEIPSKKAFERLENKVNIMDVELASVQRKISNK